jgi:hypothetical protein
VYSGLLGYSNFENSNIQYTGGQFALFFKSDKTTNGLLSYSWLNYKKKDLNKLETFAIRPPSGSMWQWRQTVTPSDNTTVIFDLIKYKKLAQKGGENPDNKFWTVDIVCRYSFTERFDAYFKIVNLFNRHYSGILPDGDPADLLRYNPQSGFFLRLGMNYNIE